MGQRRKGGSWNSEGGRLRGRERERERRGVKKRLTLSLVTGHAVGTLDPD